MRKHLALLTLLVALVFGFSTQTFAKEITVKKGDSIWIIAKRYHAPFLEVLKLNKAHHINLNLIHPGDKIFLPEKGTGAATNNASSSDKIQSGNSTAAESGTTQQAQAVLRLVNAERAKQGLQSLKLSSKLTDIATLKAQDINDKGYFSHTSPTYGSPFEMMQHFGIKYSTAGENIAKGQKTADEVMRDWIASSGHRANILGNYTQIGIGFYNNVWVQLFITPQ